MSTSPQRRRRARRDATRTAPPRLPPADYVNGIVVPTVREFGAKPRCRRRS
jgi:hypothetical protein